jgi:lipoate-protein ligase A
MAMNSPFDRLLVWRDPVARSGPENMAVDELLMEGLGEAPVLRIYHWEGDWVSLGYFQKLEEARRLFEGERVEFVRRMTGGGLVDHRNDLTYTLCVPRGHALAEQRGEGSYRMIHAAVVGALQQSGCPARMVTEDEAGESLACFEKAVAWDVVGESGRKLAGAGQKRGKAGLLHQGSVLAGEDVGQVLATCLSEGVMEWEPRGDIESRARELATTKYATEAWMGRR